MDISEYTDFFHDGSLIEIEHKNDKIELSMSSAEVDKTDLKEPIELSKSDRIMGKLHIEGVTSIKIGDNPLKKQLKKEYDGGQIFDFEIKNLTVTLAIQWVNYPLKPETNFFSVITIEGEKIYWENIPSLEYRKFQSKWTE
ncbi:MAG: hypothetical protein FJZ63_03215 [Chlamydiae bacterium]|nr:hypothetical protein [Chlamydiota bacterium]